MLLARTGILASGETIAGTFESIATFVAGGGETVLTFSSIPQTYESLQLRVFVRDTGGSAINGLLMRVNGSSSVYYNHSMQGGGASAGSTNTGTTATYSQSSYGLPHGTSLANTFGVSVIDFPDYASTTRLKTIRRFEGVDLNGSGNVARTNTLYNATTAISSISVYPPTTGFAGNCVFALYGIKGA